MGLRVGSNWLGGGVGWSLWEGDGLGTGALGWPWVGAWGGLGGVGSGEGVGMALAYRPCCLFCWPILPILLILLVQDGLVGEGDEVVPSKILSFDEVKGSVIADFQTLLESKWIDKLRSKYNLIVYNDVLDELKRFLN